MSKSETKARNGHTLTKENRMIPQFIWAGKECWRSFVTDLDILARDRLLLCLWTWVTVLCQDIGDTSVGSGGDTCGLRLSGEL